MLTTFVFLSLFVCMASASMSCHVDRQDNKTHGPAERCEIENTSCDGSNPSTDTGTNLSDLEVNCWTEETMQLTWKFHTEYSDPVFRLTMTEKSYRSMTRVQHCYTVSVASQVKGRRGRVTLYMAYPHSHPSGTDKVDVVVTAIKSYTDTGSHTSHQRPVRSGGHSVQLSFMKGFCDLCVPWDKTSVIVQDVSSLDGHCSFNVRVTKATTLGVWVNLTSDSAVGGSHFCPMQNETCLIPFHDRHVSDYTITVYPVCRTCQYCVRWECTHRCSVFERPSKSPITAVQLTGTTSPPDIPLMPVAAAVVGIVILVSCVTVAVAVIRRRRKLLKCSRATQLQSVQSVPLNTRLNIDEVFRLDPGTHVVVLPLSEIASVTMDSLCALLSDNVNGLSVYHTSSEQLERYWQDVCQWADYIEHPDSCFMFLTLGQPMNTDQSDQSVFKCTNNLTNYAYNKLYDPVFRLHKQRPSYDLYVYAATDQRIEDTPCPAYAKGNGGCGVQTVHLTSSDSVKEFVNCIAQMFDFSIRPRLTEPETDVLIDKFFAYVK